MFSRVLLRYKIAFSVGIVTLTTVLTIGRLGFNPLGDIALEELALRTQVAAAAAASYVDPAWMQNVPADQVGASAQYHRLRQQIQQLKDKGQVDGFHLFRFRNGREAESLYDSYTPSSPYHKPPGSVENIVESPVIFESEADHGALRMDRPGEWMGAWVPVRDAAGNQLGNMIALVEYSELASNLAEAAYFITVMAVLFACMAVYAGYRVGLTFEQTAVTDGLMGIYNHRHFKQRLEVEVARAARYNLPLSLVMIDIDHFKSVNDTYGHAVGDLVLKQLAKWVSGSTRRTDLVARYGGEEIAVMLPHTGLAGAQEFAERLRLKVANEMVRDLDEEVTLRVTISVGVAQYERGLSMIDFIKRADTALYQSKHNGRNRVTVWTDDLVPIDAQGTQAAAAVIPKAAEHEA